MLQLLKEKISYLFRREILALIILDCLLLPAALFSAVWLRLGAEWDPKLNSHIWVFFLVPLFTIPLFVQLGLYRAIIRFLDDTVVYIVFLGVTASVLILTMFVYFSHALAFPRSSMIIYWLIAVTYIGGSRFMLRGILRKIGISNEAKPIAIYGAGTSGVQLASSLSLSNEYTPMFFVDDEESKWHSTIRGLKVFPPHVLVAACQAFKIVEVLLAIPSAPLMRHREIIQNLEKNSIYVKTLPGIASIISGEVSFSDIKEVDIEDLLGRLPVPANQELLTKNIVDKIVLVTGAGGSIGSELCRQIARLKPQRLVILDSSEFALYTIEQELRTNFGYLALSVVLADVTSASQINKIFARYSLNTIYHAAAYKHVPMVEANPLAGLGNNVLGTYVVANAAIKARVDNMVLISTDKAVRPTNVMGASKRFAELIMQAFAEQSGHTIFNMVRFGNVLGSSGSVVPLFRRQIKAGGPVTVTHPDIIRYFMTIPEAVELVIQAGNMASGGEVFVLDMGEPVKIVNLAREMIYLSGFTVCDKDNPRGDIEIHFTGLRPGEKLFEELLIGDNPTQTLHERIMKANESFLPLAELKPLIELLADFIRNAEATQALELLQQVVKEYKPAKMIV